jgi:hypothetical protein
MSAPTLTVHEQTVLVRPERAPTAAGSSVGGFGDRVIVAFSAADDVRSGMARVVVMRLTAVCFEPLTEADPSR